ncbi:hypothetical protein NHX12_000774 [Muraenolepis orangiensis]|uniref:FHA domain-containing protein n=1 Tax=Muraenolepis orangiensis TaxID=630683 RepID=A0A9Q0DZ70_9TELE|nr:hypothetical protein NHX12_000774 [Muraenolepis orangiensis]
MHHPLGYTTHITQAGHSRACSREDDEVPSVSPREWEEEGQLWVQHVSTMPCTRTDMVNLQGQLDAQLQRRQALETGICPVRRDLYSQYFASPLRVRVQVPQPESCTEEDQQEGGEGDEPPPDKEKPDFGLSGALTEDTNTFRGVVIKYNEPPEARIPKRRWRLYPFKNDEQLPVMYIHRQSAYLLGRQRKIADIPIDHPSCSKQHAVFNNPWPVSRVYAVGSHAKRRSLTLAWVQSRPSMAREACLVAWPVVSKPVIERSKRRRAGEEDEAPATTKMTSKQRRAAERATKLKVGARYYETHNVKNKNRDRKLPVLKGKKAKR